MIVVANAGPLIALARIGQLVVLPSLYREIRLPEAVRKEVVVAGEGRAGSEEIEGAEWVRWDCVCDKVGVGLLSDRLDAGESEAIVLAIEENADLLLIDEERGRRVAESRGIAVVGTLGTLVLAKKRGILERVTPHLDALLASGFRMVPALYDAVLQLADETV